MTMDDGRHSTTAVPFVHDYDCSGSLGTLPKNLHILTQCNAARRSSTPNSKMDKPELPSAGRCASHVCRSYALSGSAALSSIWVWARNSPDRELVLSLLRQLLMSVEGL